MRKDTVLGMSAVAILMVLYILVALLVPFVHTTAFWFSFIFTIIGFFVVGFAVYIAFFKNIFIVFILHFFSYFYIIYISRIVLLLNLC